MYAVFGGKDMGKISIVLSDVSKAVREKGRLRVLGIDLGTTNSVAAEIIFDPHKPDDIDARCVKINQDTLDGSFIHYLVPSVVAIYEGKRWVGEGARRMIALSNKLDLVKNRDLFYECKNDMGITRTYHRAPEGFQSASEIGGHILEFILNQVRKEDPTPIDRVVVTVPASFQLAQRVDTVNSAKLAGLEVSGGDLLDEPVAVFLDYMLSHEDKFLFTPAANLNVLVFDFGGGTCDVAIFRLSRTEKEHNIGLAALAVSRYHRLGGGDLDRAILYDILVPRLLEENGLGQFDLSYTDKRQYLEPPLLAVAEALKIKMSKEIERLQAFSKYNDADKEMVITRLPGNYECPLRDGTVLTLQNPSLSAAEFEEVLKPFLDQDLLYPREDEYKLVCSIFAPLQDALSRSGLGPDDIDYCLLLGGSSLIPQVKEAVAGYFFNAEVLSYEDAEIAQTAMAKGAAYHALFLALQGRGFIEPICHETIHIRTQSGFVPLVPKGTKLPYPSGQPFQELESLVVPETVHSGSLLLRLEIVAGEEERILACESWEISGPVEKGDPLICRYRYDENQVLRIDLALREPLERQSVYHLELDKPFSNVVNPNPIRERIYEREEELRHGRVTPAQRSEVLHELARDYAKIGQREKALEYMNWLLRQKGPDVVLLNEMGILYGELGDWGRQEKFYREAANVSNNATPLFNLALSKYHRGLYTEALVIIDEALELEIDGPYLVLKALILKQLGQPKETESCLHEAINLFSPLEMMSDWELSWYLLAARQIGDGEKVKTAEDEQKRRKIPAAQMTEGILPEIRQGE